MAKLVRAVVIRSSIAQPTIRREYKSDRLASHYKGKSDHLLRHEVIGHDAPGADVGVIAYGSSHWAVLEAIEQLKAAGVNASYLRVRALPLHPDVHAFVRSHARVYVVEQNRDGQLAALLRDDLPAYADRLVSVLQYDGLPLDATTVVDGVLSHRASEGGAR